MERKASPSRREVRKSRREMVILFRRFLVRQAGRQDVERLEKQASDLVNRVRELEESDNAQRQKHDEREQALITALTQANADGVTLQRRLDLAQKESARLTQQIVNVENQAAERAAAARAEAAQAIESLTQRMSISEQAAANREVALQAEWSRRLNDAENWAKLESERDARRIANLRRRLASVEHRLAVLQHWLGPIWRAAMVARRVWHQARGRGDAWTTMPASFQQLKEDTTLFVRPCGRFRLQPGDDLRTAGASYRIALRRMNLSGVRLAVAVEEPYATGWLGVEVAIADCIVARTEVPLTDVRDGEPVAIRFPAVSASGGQPIELRISQRGASAGVRVFELRRWTCGGLGRLVRHPFASYIFSEGPDP
jgi:hypothetical protein